MSYVPQIEANTCASVAIYNALIYFNEYVDIHSYNLIKQMNNNFYNQPTTGKNFNDTLYSFFRYPYSICKTQVHPYELVEALDNVTQVAIIVYDAPINHITLYVGKTENNYIFINHHNEFIYTVPFSYIDIHVRNELIWIYTIND